MGEMTKEENVGPALQDWPSRVNLLRKSLAKMSCPVACGNLMISEGRTKVCPLLSLYREMIILALTPTTFLISFTLLEHSVFLRGCFHEDTLG